MVNFANLKKNSSSNLDKLSKAVESMSSGSDNSQENYWKCEVDKSGNGYAIIRFLPAPPMDGDEGLPWVKYYDHGFQGPGGWYIEKSLTSPTINKPDPVSEHNSALWATGIEANKELARKQKRRLHYVSNIYVVKDSKHPENEGKVFLYVYGKKIFEKLIQAMKPQFEDDKPVDPFDLWNGANFKLKVRKVDGYQNYDLAEFDTPGPLVDDDSELERIWNSSYSLNEIVDEKNFKSYDVLKKRLDRVLGLDATELKSRTTVEQAKLAPQVQQSNSVKSNLDVLDAALSSDSEDDDGMDYFSKLVNDDDDSPF